MPKPNTLNPINCGHAMRKNGKTKAGALQYRCKCGFTCTDSDRPAYRKGEKLATAMSARERFKKWYAKHKKVKR